MPQNNTNQQASFNTSRLLLNIRDFVGVLAIIVLIPILAYRCAGIFIDWNGISQEYHDTDKKLGQLKRHSKRYDNKEDILEQLNKLENINNKTAEQENKVKELQNNLKNILSIFIMFIFFFIIIVLYHIPIYFKLILVKNVPKKVFIVITNSDENKLNL